MTMDKPDSPKPADALASAPARPKRSYRAFKIAASWVLALVVALTLQRFVFQSYQVFGHSMEPTLSEGDYLIISKLGVTWADISHGHYVPHRGDIIVLNSPLDGTRLVKRVIGLPGERVVVSGGTVTVYNSDRPEGFDPYQSLSLPPVYASGQLTMVIPNNDIFVVGDNREAGNSLDSRNDLGPVPVSDIIGKLVLRLWPPSRIDAF